jgi:acetyl esterase/lipase
MKTILFPAFLGLALFASFASGQTTVRLWPNDAPNAAGNEAQDTPTMTPFPALKETATGAAVLVCPGGGYTHLSDVKEGSDVAKWLNTLGISAFVLKYRVGPRYHQPTPMLDAARALRTVRAHAKDWQIDASRIGILGFSAGGHLASTLGTHFDSGKAEAKDEIERVSSRPDLMILIYPVITMGDFAHKGSKLNLIGENPSPDLVKLYSNELHVTKDTPPAFLAHAVTDPGVPVENSLMFADALRKAGVPFELHLYEQGPHGFGLAPNNPILASWTERCADWLRVHGFAKPRSNATVN